MLLAGESDTWDGFGRMRIRIQYFAVVRELANLREEILDVDEGTTVRDLLKVLATKHGEKLKQYLFDPKSGNPRPYLQFLLDEKSISNLNGFETVLKEASVFAIIPPVGGG